MIGVHRLIAQCQAALGSEGPEGAEGEVPTAPDTDPMSACAAESA
jgi:hypothetical protein